MAQAAEDSIEVVPGVAPGREWSHLPKSESKAFDLWAAKVAAAIEEGEKMESFQTAQGTVSFPLNEARRRMEAYTRTEGTPSNPVWVGEDKEVPLAIKKAVSAMAGVSQAQ